MGDQNSSPNFLLVAQLTLRFLVVASTMAAITMTVTTQQAGPFEVTEIFYYKNSPPMKFGVGTNAVVGILSFASMILVYALKSPKVYPKKHFHLFLHDMVMTMLSISGCAVVTAEHFVARFGQTSGEFSLLESYCPQVEKYCHKMLTPLVFSYLAFACIFTLAIMSAHKLGVTAPPS